jgi:hypothetical protein
MIDKYGTPFSADFTWSSAIGATARDLQEKQESVYFEPEDRPRLSMLTAEATSP